MEALLRASDTTGVISAENEIERANIWKVRKSSYSAFGRLAPNNFVQDSVVPRRHLGATLREVNRIADTAGLQCPNVCHAGDGNLHPNLLYDGEDPGAFERAEKAAGEILRMCVDFGGSITGEHGVGLEKRAFLSLMYGPAELDLFRCIHRAFDPTALSNPGKMLPSPDQTTAPLHPLVPNAATLEIARQIKARPASIAIGRGTKTLNHESVASQLSLAPTAGITAYEPVEFILTAGAGTPLKAVVAALAESNQQLLFDPPFIDSGATLGGAFAAGLNGPGAFGAGRARDAILGMTFIDGRGEIMRVGAAVVKNVAGFDLPKLFVGSHGSLGIMTEITLRVCPLPAAQQTFVIDCTAVGMSRQIAALANLPTRPAAIEASPIAGKIWIRFDAPESALPALAKSIEPMAAQPLTAPAAAAIWADLREFHWASSEGALLKIPAGLGALDRLRAVIDSSDGTLDWHISLGGDVVYIAVPDLAAEALRGKLTETGFAVQTIRGSGPRLLLPHPLPQIVHDLKTCFDPDGRLAAVPGTVRETTGV